MLVPCLFAAVSLNAVITLLVLSWSAFIIDDSEVDGCNKDVKPVAMSGRMVNGRLAVSRAQPFDRLINILVSTHRLGDRAIVGTVDWNVG